MRLAEWFTESGLTKSLADVEYFGFGAAGYYVKMCSGVIHFDNDLDRILATILDEATALNAIISMLWGSPQDAARPSGSNKLTRRVDVDLIVHISCGASSGPEYNKARIEAIRQQVTLYNILGRWDDNSRSNL